MASFWGSIETVMQTAIRSKFLSFDQLLKIQEFVQTLLGYGVVDMSSDADDDILESIDVITGSQFLVGGIWGAVTPANPRWVCFSRFDPAAKNMSELLTEVA